MAQFTTQTIIVRSLPPAHNITNVILFLIIIRHIHKQIDSHLVGGGGGGGSGGGTCI